MLEWKHVKPTFSTCDLSRSIFLALTRSRFHAAYSFDQHICLVCASVCLYASARISKWIGNLLTYLPGFRFIFLLFLEAWYQYHERQNRVVLIFLCASVYVHVCVVKRYAGSVGHREQYMLMRSFKSIHYRSLFACLHTTLGWFSFFIHRTNNDIHVRQAETMRKQSNKPNTHIRTCKFFSFSHTNS